MNEQKFSLAAFLEAASPLLTTIRALTNAVRSPGTPARSRLGASQTKLLVAAVRASDASNVINMVMEQVVTSANHISQTNIDEEAEYIMRSGDKLITLLQIAQHNFALASRGSLETINDNDLDSVRSVVTKNAETYAQCWARANEEKTEAGWKNAEEELSQKSKPLSYGEIALFIRHDILPSLMDIVEKLRDAFPIASANCRSKAEETYAVLLLERPELIDRFRETGAPFFDEARDGRLAELQIASFYNGGSYRYTPIKPTTWQVAYEADSAASTRFPKPKS